MCWAAPRSSILGARYSTRREHELWVFLALALICPCLAVDVTVRLPTQQANRLWEDRSENKHDFATQASPEGRIPQGKPSKEDAKSCHRTGWTPS